MEAVVHVVHAEHVVASTVRSVVIPVASIASTNVVKRSNYPIKMIYVIILLQYVIYCVYHMAYGSRKSQPDSVLI